MRHGVDREMDWSVRLGWKRVVVWVLEGEKEGKRKRKRCGEGRGSAAVGGPCWVRWNGSLRLYFQVVTLLGI